MYANFATNLRLNGDKMFGYFKQWLKGHQEQILALRHFGRWRKLGREAAVVLGWSFAIIAINVMALVWFIHRISFLDKLSKKSPIFRPLLDLSMENATLKSLMLYILIFGCFVCWTLRHQRIKPLIPLALVLSPGVIYGLVATHIITDFVLITVLWTLCVVTWTRRLGHQRDAEV